MPVSSALLSKMKPMAVLAAARDDRTGNPNETSHVAHRSSRQLA
jgi:hypothetical protein